MWHSGRAREPGKTRFGGHVREAPHNYILPGNEAIAGTTKAAMRRTVRIRGRGALLLATVGLLVCTPGSSGAQEKTAQQADSRGASSQQPLQRRRRRRLALTHPFQES
jgi:hypothetical protein